MVRLAATKNSIITAMYTTNMYYTSRIRKHILASPTTHQLWIAGVLVIKLFKCVSYMDLYVSIL